MTDIKVKDLCFGYNKDELIFNGFNFNAQQNESIGIIGANGAGKSTLLKLLIGLNLNFTGEIKINDITLCKKTLEQIRQKTGYVFQDSDSQLFMTNVYDDVAFGPRSYGLTEAEVKEKVLKALNLTHTEHLKDRIIYTLSGGQKKLVSIATILSMSPEIVLMDEPSIGLDPKNRRNLINILNGFNYLKIITSHDLDFIWDTCSRVVLINSGKLIKEGSTEQILRDKDLLEANGLELPLSLSRM